MCTLDSRGAKVGSSSTKLLLVPTDFNLLCVTGKWTTYPYLHALLASFHVGLAGLWSL